MSNANSTIEYLRTTTEVSPFDFLLTDDNDKAIVKEVFRAVGYDLLLGQCLLLLDERCFQRVTMNTFKLIRTGMSMLKYVYCLYLHSSIFELEVGTDTIIITMKSLNPKKNRGGKDQHPLTFSNGAEYDVYPIPKNGLGCEKIAVLTYGDFEIETSMDPNGNFQFEPPPYFDGRLFYRYPGSESALGKVP